VGRKELLMTNPLVTPFRAERYADLGALSSLIAPPYDVISPVDRMALAAKDPHNIVHLILPEPPEGDERDRYTFARALLDAWRFDGTIVPDGDPAAYVIQQAFTTHDGKSHTRTGVIAAVTAEPFDEGRVKPHERTHEGPKEDRLALMRATDAMFEALFMFARDESGNLAARLTSATEVPPTTTAYLDGVEISLWRLSGGTATAVAQAASEQPLYIADGHHRFETAVAYRAEAPGATRVPVLIVPVRDPGLVVLPTHRMIAGSLDRSNAIERLRERFQIREMDASANYVEELASLEGRGTACVVVFSEGPAMALLLKGGVSLGDIPFANEPTVATLDIARIDAFVVDALRDLAGDESVLTYSANANEVIDAVRSGRVQAGVLVNSTSVDDVLTVADAGAVMPPKSTYFMPKVPSGLVLMPLGGE
jgi:uncharacterized protein (DUF1015 family)